ncbi:hypothetical protein XENOCAPTIV_001280 [Xenoophorus captivus]|uniref:Uncharacterized protein n=1 Tax=Xenoophorus captivus TaxID=1517983 RepID=A0ABV0QCH8_9TELE
MYPKEGQDNKNKDQMSRRARTKTKQSSGGRPGGRPLQIRVQEDGREDDLSRHKVQEDSREDVPARPRVQTNGVGTSSTLGAAMRKLAVELRRLGTMVDLRSVETTVVLRRAVQKTARPQVPPEQEQDQAVEAAWLRAPPEQEQGQAVEAAGLRAPPAPGQEQAASPPRAAPELEQTPGVAADGPRRPDLHEFGRTWGRSLPWPCALPS